MSAQIYDILVIGGGPAGYTAALYAVRAGHTCLVLEKMGAGGQMTETAHIDNYPGLPAGTDGISLGAAMAKSAEDFGAVTVFDQVQGAELTGEIKTVTGLMDTYRAKAVIIATGAAHRHAGLAGEAEFAGRGVAYCATCDGMFYRGRDVAVMGGGNSAVADALYLSGICRSVTLIHRRDTLRASKASAAPLLQKENVKFLWDSEITEIKGDAKVTALAVKNKKTGEAISLPVDGLFVSIGRAPVTAPFGGQIAIDEAGYIVAGEDTQTSLAGVFAAGDVRTKPLRQIVTATADGAVAAEMAAAYLLTKEEKHP